MARKIEGEPVPPLGPVVDTAMKALHCKTLDEFAEIAGVLGPAAGAWRRSKHAPDADTIKKWREDDTHPLHLYAEDFEAAALEIGKKKRSERGAPRPRATRPPPTTNAADWLDAVRAHMVRRQEHEVDAIVLLVKKLAMFPDISLDEAAADYLASETKRRRDLERKRAAAAPKKIAREG